MIKQTIERLTFLIDEESYGSALELYEKSSAVLLNSGTSPSDRKALLLLGAKIYYFNQMYESSNGCLSELQRQFDEIKSNIDFIISKFQFLSTTGKSTEALEFITKATVLGWPQDEYHRLNFYVGKAYFWTGDYVEANHRFHTCYRYFLSAGDQYMLGSISHMLGYTAFQRSFFDISKSHYEKALEYFKAIGKNYQVGAVYHMIGLLYWRTGRFAEAAEHCRLAMIHFERCENRKGIIESKIISARVSIFLEAYREAEPILFTCYQQSERINYKRGMALSAEFLGEIYYHRAEYVQSQRCLETAEKLALEMAPSGDIAVEVYRRLGDLCIAQGEYDRAEASLAKAREIAEHLSDRYELGSVYRAYGLLFARRGNLDYAISFFTESILTLQVIKEQYELARTYVIAARTFQEWCDSSELSDEYKTGLLADADTYEIEAMHIYQSIGIEHKVREIEARRKDSEKDFLPRDEWRYLDVRVDASWLYGESVVARSIGMRTVIEKVENLASGAMPVLITGETGTGKEVIARLIHRLSGRSLGPFVPVNCASVPDAVFESELFGHKKGSFTGAVSDKVGLIEQASGGTLFLDEISELSTHQQAKLLRALEDGSIRRLGETKERPIDVRVVSASNEDIDSLVKSGGLRSDFFFRISAERIELVPLRERREDIIPLFVFYMQRLCAGCKIERDIPGLVERYHWPGNVRELVNVAKALAQLRQRDKKIRTRDLPLRIRDYARSEHKMHQGPRSDAAGNRKLLSSGSCREHPDRIRELILSSLGRCDGNRSAAARELGIGRTTLYRRMQELDLL